MFRFASILCALASLALTAGPGAAQDTALEFAGLNVRPLSNPERITVQEQEGMTVLVIERAAAMLDGIEFANGVIEFDFAFENKRGFGGINWHASADGADNEYLYFRQHKSGLPDAVQYTPVRGGLSGWQIFNDRNALAPFAYTYDGWNHLKMVVANDKADIFLNGQATPQLHIPDLASDRGSGGIGFRASGPNGKITLANLTIRELAEEEGTIGAAAETPSPPPGVIENWSVSLPFAEAEVADAAALPSSALSRAPLGVLQVEPSGVADLSRLASPGDGAETVLVSTRIVAEEARPVRLQFGYSDRVRLYLNGALVFDGNAGFRSRDFFFLGTVGFKDAVILPLRQGNNVLQAAVSETFGGWAFAGAIADREGLLIAPAD